MKLDHGMTVSAPTPNDDVPRKSRSRRIWAKSARLDKPKTMLRFHTHQEATPSSVSERGFGEEDFRELRLFIHSHPERQESPSAEAKAPDHIPAEKRTENNDENDEDGGDGGRDVGRTMAASTGRNRVTVRMACGPLVDSTSGHITGSALDS